MGRSQMFKSRSFLYRAVLAATFSIAACGTLSQTSPRSLQGPQSVAPDSAPDAELSEEVLYELLVGEIALQRGDPALASQIYLDLAKRTRDPRVARRAIEVANFASLPDAALDAAKIWQSIEPASPQALQIVSALLAADGVNLESAFLQLNRLFSGNPDKAANLRVVRRLAALQPKLASAHLAVAQAARAAGDDAGALSSVRQAAALRPEWETAAIFEAQVLQKRSAAEAAK